MKRIIVLIGILISIYFDIQAQGNYAVGLRAGGTSGLTLEMKSSNGSEYEGLVGFWNHGASVTVLYKKRSEAFNVKGLDWIYGGGSHVAHYGKRFYRNNEPYWHTDYPTYVDYNTFAIGFDGLFGIEYHISQTPIAVSFEFKPFFEFVSNGDVWISMDPGIGIKFVF